MTRTKNSVLEPSRTPLQTRAGALLNHIFSPDSRQAAARRAAARSCTPGTEAAAASSSSQQQLQPYRSCSSPTLGGGSPLRAQDAAAGALQDSQRQLSGSLYDMGSIDDEEYSGLSDLLVDSNDDEQLTPAGVAAAVPTAAAAAAAIAVIGSAVASNRQATPQQENEEQQQQQSPAPAAALSAAKHDHHDAVDGSAYILETTQPVQAPASNAAATGAGGAAAVENHAVEDLHGFHAVDKMLEQLSVDVLLDQQYLLEQQQQIDAAQPTTGAEVVYSSSMIMQHQHSAMHRQSSALLPFPTGPAAAAAAATVVLQSAGTAAMHAPPHGTHKASAAIIIGPPQLQQHYQLGLVHANSVSGIPEAWQQQQHLHHTYSAPLLDRQFDMIQHGAASSVSDASAKPFSFQDLLMSDEPIAVMNLSTSFDHQQQQQQQQQQGSVFQPFSQQQQLPPVPPHAASWQQQQQYVAWEQQTHQYQQQQQLHATYSAPLPAGAASAPHRHGMPPHYIHSASDLQAMPPPQQQQQSAGAAPHGIIPFYHHQPPQQQQQQQQQQQHQGVARQPGYVNPHQAELEALKAQLAEGKRRRKEKRRMKKMHKLMLQQQQQPDLAHQVLHAAGPTNPTAAAAGAPGPPPYPAHFAPAHSRSSRQPSLPQPPWFNPNLGSRDSNRYPGPKGEGFRGPGFTTPGSGSRASMGRTSSRELPQDPAAVAARQHAVAHSLRQLAFKSEQMQRASSAGVIGSTATAAAAVDVHYPHHPPAAAVRSNSTPPSSIRYSPYSRPPVSTPESGSGCRAYEGKGAAEQPPAAKIGQQQMPAAPGVLNLVQDSPATTPPAQLQDDAQTLGYNNNSSFMPGDDELHAQQDGSFKAAALDRPGRGPRSGASGWREHHHGDVPPAGKGALALDLRSVDSVPHALEASSHRELSAGQVHSGEPHTVKIESMQRAASADAAAAIKLHGTQTNSSSTRMVYQKSPHGTAAASTVAGAGDGTVASPVSTTSSGSRKRSWNMTVEASPLQLAGPERKLTAVSSTADLPSVHAHHMSGDSHAAQERDHRITQKQQHFSSHQQQNQQYRPLGPQVNSEPILQEDLPFTCPSASGLNISRGSSAQAARGWLPALHHTKHDMQQMSQLQQRQATEQRQQRLLQLPFNRADVVEQRRPTVTTEPPAVLSSPPVQALAQQQQQQQQQEEEEVPPLKSHSAAPMPATSWEKQGTSSMALDLRTEPAASTPLATCPAAAAANAAGPNFSGPAASGLPFSSPDSIDMGIGSADGSFRQPPLRLGHATASLSAPDNGTSANGGRLAIASTGVAGVPLPGLGSPGLPGIVRQQSLSDATLAAAAAAAAAGGGTVAAGGGGGGGGSGDFSGQLGGFESPSVYRTSSGKVLRMLTHPVTGKPLLLGPAVDAKSSRLGNTSLGAPSPQLFGLELQHTHLGSLTPAPTSVVQAVLAGAGAAGPPGGLGGLGNNGSRNRVWRQGSTGKQKLRSSSATAAAGGGGSTSNESVGLGGMQQWGSNAPALSSISDTYCQQQPSEVQMCMPVPALPVYGAAAAVSWGPAGGVSGSGVWGQQQQLVPDAYTDDGLLYLESQQQQGRQQQQQAVSMQYTSTDTAGALAAAAAIVPASADQLAEEPICFIDAPADVSNVQP